MSAAGSAPNGVHGYAGAGIRGIAASGRVARGAPEQIADAPGDVAESAQTPPAESGVHTVQECIEEFLVYLDSVRGLSQNTVAAYRRDLAQFVLMPGISAGVDIRTVTTEDLRGCVGYLSRKKRAAASINRFLSSVKTLFAYCRKFEYVPVNPAAEIKSVKIPKRLPRFMTSAEVDELCAQPQKKEILWQTRDTALFEMLYSSGCRVSEIASLLLSDLTGDYSSAIVTGKGKKDRRVYFEADARAALAAYLADRAQKVADAHEAHVFVNQNGTPLTPRGIRYILSRYTGAEGTNHHVSPHAFRHTFATAMLTNGADVRLVQELLGHSSISTTQRYTHISTEKMIELYNKAHPHGGSKT